MTKRFFLCKSHPDFHLPAHVEVGKNFNAEEYGRRLKESRVDAVCFFAKCHYGHSYYPTRVGTVHPGLQQDMLKEVVEGCHKHGVGVIAYYSTFFDGKAGRDHRDWCRHESDGTVLEHRFMSICVNSPYGEELLLPQAREIVTDYDVDGIFFDTMCHFTPCYCDYCREAFGRAIPLSEEDPAWDECRKWVFERHDAFFAHVAEEMHKANPAVTVSFNWMWAERDPVMPPPDIDHLVVDAIQQEPQSLGCACNARYFAGTGTPFDLMVGRFLHGLGDWTRRPADMHRQEAATVIANGGSFWIIDRQMPDGSLQPEAYNALKDTYSFVQERRAYVEGTRHVPEIGILHNMNQAPGVRFEGDHDKRREYVSHLRGAEQMLLKYGRHFTTLNEQVFRADAHKYALIIVPEQQFLEEETKAELVRYVGNGGKLIVSQRDSKADLDAKLVDLYGVEFKGFTSSGYGYLGAAPPLLIHGPFAETALTTGTQLAPYVQPMGSAEGESAFGWGEAPAGRTTDQPAVVSNSRGAGECVYISAPIFRSYHYYQNPELAAYVLSLIDTLLPTPLVRIIAPPQVELSVVRKDNDLIVHLVNHAGEQMNGKWPLTEHVPEFRDINIALRDNGKIHELLRVPGKESLAFEKIDGYAKATLPSLHIMESVLVPGYFG